MSKGKENPGYITLVKHEEQVILTIKNNLEKVARFLRDKEIVQQNLHSQVTNPEARETKDNLAKLVYRRLISMVEENDKNYSIFLDYIRNHITQSGNTVRMLDQTYADLEGRTGTNPQGTGNCLWCVCIRKWASY